MFHSLQSVLLGYVPPGLKIPRVQIPLGKMEGRMVRLVFCSQTRVQTLTPRTRGATWYKLLILKLSGPPLLHF